VQHHATRKINKKVERERLKKRSKCGRGDVLSEEEAEGKRAEGNCLYLDEVLHQQRQQENLFSG
jgi:hypothetical protein